MKQSRAAAQLGLVRCLNAVPSAFGNIYIMANPAMPGVVKIGKTRHTVQERARKLSQLTAVAAPFQVIFSRYVYDCDGIERLIRSHLSAHRYNKGREFYALKPALAVAWVTGVILLAQKNEKEYLSQCTPFARLSYENRKKRGIPPIDMSPKAIAARDRAVERILAQLGARHNM